MKDDVTSTEFRQNAERLARRERRERNDGLAKVSRNVIAVTVDEWLPMRGRVQHVVRMAGEIRPLIPVRKLGDRASREHRQPVIHGREFLAIPELRQGHRGQFGHRQCGNRGGH